jgi:hypothetical protein
MITLNQQNEDSLIVSDALDGIICWHEDSDLVQYQHPHVKITYLEQEFTFRLTAWNFREKYVTFVLKETAADLKMFSNFSDLTVTLFDETYCVVSSAAELVIGTDWHITAYFV